MNIELHIEELVLHGFAPGDRHRIVEAAQFELQRLLAERGAPQLFDGSIDLARIDAGSFDLKPGANAEGVGAQVARAIYGGMNR
jgi:hypothetical protein